MINVVEECRRKLDVYLHMHLIFPVVEFKKTESDTVAKGRLTKEGMMISTIKVSLLITLQLNKGT